MIELTEVELADEELLLAYRYLYYVHGISMISDHDYDRLEKIARENADMDSPLHLPGSDLPDSYRDSTRALATYLVARRRERMRGD